MVNELQPGDDKAPPPAAPTDNTGLAVQDKPDDAGSLDQVRLDTHGARTAAGDTRPAPQRSAVGDDGFEILMAQEGGSAEADRGDGARVETLPNLREKFDAEKLADQIEKACNGGLTGIGTDIDGILNALKDLTPEQIAQVDQKFATKHGVKYARQGQRWGLQEEFRDEMSGAALERGLAIINAKNEVPEALRVAGADTLKDQSLKAGETNRVTFPDGRKYDVYIPQNAQKPLPVVMMMHGASGGHDQSEGRILEKEAGMNQVAEQYGFAVVYAFSEPNAGSGMATWNLHGRKNFQDTNSTYDDATYLDRVIADVGNRVNVDDSRMGIAGMSDGGRAAEQYALDRPGKFSALSIMHGTWMNGERKPEAGTGTPIMIVHGTDDYMLPHNQGSSEGRLWEKGRGFMSLLASWHIPHTTESRPGQQIGVFKDANQCEGEATQTKSHHTDITSYNADQCKVGEVKQYMINDVNHAWQDWRNAGGWYVVGMPDRTQNMSEETAKFILNHRARRHF